MSHEKTFGTIDAKRRALLAAAGSAALAAPLFGTAGFAHALTPKRLTPLSFAWNQTSFCLTPIAVAKEAGIFEKCVVGVGGKLVRENRPAVAALARSLVEAYDWTSSHIDESARIFLKYTTNITFEELQALYGTLNLHHHPVGADLHDEIVAFARDFKGLGVLKPATDPVKYADRVFEKVL